MKLNVVLTFTVQKVNDAHLLQLIRLYVAFLKLENFDCIWRSSVLSENEMSNVVEELRKNGYFCSYDIARMEII